MAKFWPFSSSRKRQDKAKPKAGAGARPSSKVASKAASKAAPNAASKAAPKAAGAPPAPAAKGKPASAGKPAAKPASREELIKQAMAIRAQKQALLENLTPEQRAALARGIHKKLGMGGKDE